MEGRNQGREEEKREESRCLHRQHKTKFLEHHIGLTGTEGRIKSWDEEEENALSSSPSIPKRERNIFNPLNLFIPLKNMIEMNEDEGKGKKVSCRRD